MNLLRILNLRLPRRSADLGRPPARRRIFARRRTAKSALTACATGIVLILASHAALVATYHRSHTLRDPAFHHRAKRFERALHNAPHDSTVVAFGSSRMHYAWLGGVVENAVQTATSRPCAAYNFSFAASGPVMSRLTLERLLDRGIRPDHVVIEIFMAMVVDLNGRPFETAMLAPVRFGAGEVKTLERYGFDGKALRRRHNEVAMNPIQNLHDEIYSRIVPEWLPADSIVGNARNFDDHGGRPVPAVLFNGEQRKSNAQFMVGHYTKALTGKRLSPHSCQALEDLLALCREQGIGATVVLLPEAASFRACYPPALVSDTQAALARLATEFPEFKVMDAREWLADDDFIDGHHMHDVGAVKFTRRLCDEHLTAALTVGR